MNLHTQIDQVVDQWFDYLGPIAQKAHSLAGERTIRSVGEMRGFARELGYEIRYFRELPDNHPGFSVKLDEIAYIAVKRGLHAESEIYTIAHEIAHHELHLNADHGKSREEADFEANLFALLFLAFAAPSLSQSLWSRNHDGTVTGSAVVAGTGVLVLLTMASRCTQWLDARLKLNQNEDVAFQARRGAP